VVSVEQYTVYEIANILKITPQTIYNKLNNKAIFKELKQFVKKDGKHKYITIEGVEVLKRHLNIYKKMDNDFDSTRQAETEPSLDNKHLKASQTKVDNELIDTLKSQIEYLKEHTRQQLEAKDKQIDTLMRLNENNQSLLMQTQKKVELLEQDTKANKSIWRKFWK
jgi:cellobiose-specific phosphotransferase system component IIB